MSKPIPGNDRPKILAIIPSAGTGSRMGRGAVKKIKKNYMELSGRPVLARTLEAFEKTPLIGEVIVVTVAEDLEYCQNEIVKKYALSKVVAVLSGGKERQDSVYNALEYAAENLDCDIILIHDGARPLVTGEVIEAVVTSVKEYGSGVAAMPVKDTIKEVSSEGIISSTPPRERLRAVQTPQGFPGDIIIAASRAARKNGVTCTDESSLVERLGIEVRVVQGSYENIKITTAEDIPLAEAILKARTTCGGA